MEKKRNGEIDLLRFIFALIIVLAHFNDSFKFGFFSHGHIGVEFFFLVTGYLMAKKAAGNNQVKETKEIADDTWKFMIHKISVFLPYYICAFIVLVLNMLFVNGWTFRQCAYELLRSIPNLSFVFMGITTRSALYVGGSWYLSAMVVGLFILYPFLLKDYHLSTKILFPLAGMFLLGYTYQTYSHITANADNYTFLTAGVIRAIAEMAIGASIYELTLRIPKWKVPVWILTTLKYFSYSAVLLYATGISQQTFDIHAFLWCAIGVALSFSNVGYVIKETKLTRYLAKISLPIYIFHSLFRYAAVEKLGVNISNTTLFVLIIGTLVTSLLLMYVTDYVVKKCKGKLE